MKNSKKSNYQRDYDRKRKEAGIPDRTRIRKSIEYGVQVAIDNAIEKKDLAALHVLKTIIITANLDLIEEPVSWTDENQRWDRTHCAQAFRKLLRSQEMRDLTLQLQKQPI